MSYYKAVASRSAISSSVNYGWTIVCTQNFPEFDYEAVFVLDGAVDALNENEIMLAAFSKPDGGAFSVKDARII